MATDQNASGSDGFLDAGGSASATSEINYPASAAVLGGPLRRYKMGARGNSGARVDPWYTSSPDPTGAQYTGGDTPLSDESILDVVQT